MRASQQPSTTHRPDQQSFTVEELWNALYSGDERLDRLPYQHQQNQRVGNRPVPTTEPAVPQKDEPLDVNAAAKLIGMSTKWVYRNWRTLPYFLVPAGKKPRIRFKREALERWIRSHSFN